MANDAVTNALRLAKEPSGQSDKVRFAIQPQGGAPTGPVRPFPQLPDGRVRFQDLTNVFNNAINYHKSLPRADRIANSMAAKKIMAGFNISSLLGKNEKLLKSEKGYKGQEPVRLPDGRGIETTGLPLSPAFEMRGFNTCPNHASCKAECLGKTSGNYFKVGGGMNLNEFKGPRLNSLRKTLFMIEHSGAFATRLYDEIAAARQEAENNGNHLGIRLNVLSDINPEVHKEIIKSFPDVSFYDYTKMKYNPVAPNHHYTYSSTGLSQPGVLNPHGNWRQMKDRLEKGDNVAMAFTDKEHLPESVFDEESGKTYKVVNGDKHDFRPLDLQPEGQNGVIVGLKNKKVFGKVGDAHVDSKGFFVKYDPGRVLTKKGTYERDESQGVGPSGKPLLGPTKVTNKQVIIGRQPGKITPNLNNNNEVEPTNA
jgi:hypothetical protein